MNDDTLQPYTTGSHRADRCVIACAGLDLPADVPEGAVKRLADAAIKINDLAERLPATFFQYADWLPKQMTASADLRAALRDLTGESK